MINILFFLKCFVVAIILLNVSCSSDNKKEIDIFLNDNHQNGILLEGKFKASGIIVDNKKEQLNK